MTKAILFDLGDTLFRLNPMPEVTDDFTAFLESEGVVDADTEPLRIVETLREYWARQGRDLLEERPVAEIARPFIGSDEQATRFAAKLDALLAEADVARWEPPQRAGLFDALRSRGLRVGFVSNTLTAPEVMKRRLREFELLGHAEVAVFSVEHRVRKPNPEIYRVALRSLSVDPADVIFVGDRVREDVRGPQSLGMRAVLTHEFRQEDPADAAPLAVVEKLDDLVRLL